MSGFLYILIINHFGWYTRQESNLRHLVPETSALPLSYGCTWLYFNTQLKKAAREDRLSSPYRKSVVADVCYAGDQIGQYIIHILYCEVITENIYDRLCGCFACLADPVIGNFGCSSIEGGICSSFMRLVV